MIDKSKDRHRQELLLKEVVKLLDNIRVRIFAKEILTTVNCQD